MTSIPFELKRALSLYNESRERYAPHSLRSGPEVISPFLALAEAGQPAYERNTLPAHFTGSALVVTPDRNHVLLTLHRKLGKWLQLGGHADGDLDLWRVARRESEEEGGLAKLTVVESAPWGNIGADLSSQLMDIDIHWIPERKTTQKVESGHYHYDARFVFVALEPEKIKISDESHALEWFTLERAIEMNCEWSMQRLLLKLQWWLQRMP